MWISAALTSIIAFSVAETMSPSEQMFRLAYSNNNFGIVIHRKLAEMGDGNVFFSPLSISSVLTMLYRGSRGETANELRKLLHYTKFDDSLIFSAFQHYLSEVILKFNPKQYTIKLVSAMVVDNSLPVLPEYKTAMQDIFQAFVENVNVTEENALVVDRMNTWAKIKTNGAITELVEEIDPGTKLFLASAAYFKGAWIIPFKLNNTKNHPFYNGGDRLNISDVPMMHFEESVRYFEDEMEDFTAIELLYQGRNASMVICLPNKYDGLEDLEKNMTATKLQFVRRAMFYERTHLTMPKFKLETDYKLSRTLKELGFKRMFRSGSNLSDMIPDGSELVLDEVKHKATIEVNEQGSVASAFTRAIMRKSMPFSLPDPVFKVDHPFLFAIFDTRNSMVLFMGRVNYLPEVSGSET